MDVPPTNNNWSQADNWVGGTVADGAGALAEFNTDITADRTVTVDTPRTIGSMQFSDNGAAGSAWTLAGSDPLTFSGATSTVTARTGLTIDTPVALTSGLTVVQYSPQPVRFSKPISGAGNLTIDSRLLNGAPVVLEANNTFVGTINLWGDWRTDEGIRSVVRISSDANLGDATNGIDFDGGIIHCTSSFSFSPGRVLHLPDGGGGGISVDAGQTVTLPGFEQIDGNGIGKYGPGTLVISNDNATSTTIANTVYDGVLDLRHPNAGEAYMAGGAVHLRYDSPATFKDISLDATGVLRVGRVGTSATNVTLAIPNLHNYSPAETLTIEGEHGYELQVTDSVTMFQSFDLDVQSADVALTGTLGGSTGRTLGKKGPGTLTLGGSTANTTAIAVRVDGGTLVLNKFSGTSAKTSIVSTLTIGDGAGVDTVRLDFKDQISNSADVIINSSGVLDLNGKTDTIRALSMTGGLVTTGTGTLTLGGNLTTSAHTTSATIAGKLGLGSSTRTITVADGTAGYDLEISAAVSGSAGLTKAGPGTLLLSGDNTYSGRTTITQGTLTLGSAAWGRILTAGGADVRGGKLVFDYTGGGSPGAACVVPLILGRKDDHGARRRRRRPSAAAWRAVERSRTPLGGWAGAASAPPQQP